MSEYWINAGFCLNITGSVLNALHVDYGFLVWMLSNAMCAGYFHGAAEKWWILKPESERFMCGTYCFFFVTAVVGWMW